MAGASEVRAGGAYVEIGAKLAPLKKALSAARTALKGFSGAAKTAARATIAVAGKMVAAFKKVAGAVAGIVRRVKDFAIAWGKRAFAAASVYLGLAAREAANFEAAMAEVWSITNLAREGIEEFSTEVLALAREVGAAPRTLARSLYQVLSAGVAAEDAMKLLAVASKAAIAGVTDTFVAVDVLTTIINSYGKSAKDAMLASDILFTIVREGKTTFAELGGSLGRVVAIAAQTGITLNEVGAVMATLTKGGLSTDEAVTSLRATIISILKPSESATKLAKKLNIQFDLQALKAKGLHGVLHDVAEATGGNAEVVAELFPNIRALNGVLALTGSQAKTYSQQMRIMGRVSGSTEKASKKIVETMQRRMKRAYVEIQVQMIKLGKTVMPIVIAAMERTTKWVALLTNWITENADTIKAYWAEAIYYVGDAWKWLVDTVKPIFAALQGGHDTMMDAMVEKAGAAWEVIKTLWYTADAVLQPLMRALAAALRGDWEDAWDEIAQAVGEAMDAALMILETYVPKLIEMGMNLLWAIIEGMKDAKVMSRIVEIVSAMWEAFTSSTIVNKLTELGKQIGAAILEGVTSTVWEGIKGLPGKISRGVAEVAAIPATYVAAAAKESALAKPITSAGLQQFATGRGIEVGGGGGGQAGITINNLYKQTDTDLRQQAATSKLLTARGRL